MIITFKKKVLFIWYLDYVEDKIIYYLIETRIIEIKANKNPIYL
jgi:hypothetical protein